MRFLEILRMVWINILENKSKVMLTSLGLIVGSATIVLVIAIGQGGQAEVAEQFKNLNAGSIDIKATDTAFVPGMLPPDFFAGGVPGGGGGGGAGTRGGTGGSSTIRRVNPSRRVRLSEEDAETLRELVPNLEVVTISASQTTKVFGGIAEEETDATVVGVKPEYRQVHNLSLLYGDFITDEDNTTTRYAAVVGFTLATDMFGHPAYALDDYISIDGKNYRIVGVLDEMGSVASGIGSDKAVYVPYTTGVKTIFGNTADPVITCVSTEISKVEQAIANIQTVLKANHADGNFSVTDAGSAMAAAKSSANTLAMLLFAVATIVFIVGGIGVMNVLFVSVKERTPEIGILKAVGCPAGTILAEFLLEAVFMGVAGGLLGIASSFGLVPLLEMLGMRLEPTLTGYLLAVVFAVVTAGLFGLYPAFKASKLVPIEALALNA